MEDTDNVLTFDIVNHDIRRKCISGSGYVHWKRRKRVEPPTRLNV